MKQNKTASSTTQALLPSATRQHAVLGLLFVLAFGAVLALANHQRVAGKDKTDNESAVGATLRVASAAPGSEADRPQAERAARPSALATSSGSELTAEQLKTIDRLTKLVAVPTEEATMEEREQRGDAIREVATLSGPQAVHALASALHNDSDVRNRILAVEGLRRVAASGDQDWAVRDALKDASSSTDETIATHARDAYDDLIKQLGTQR